MRVCSLVKKASEKVLKVCVELELKGEACVVRDVQVTGDFFAVNPDGIDHVVKSVIGADALGVEWTGFLRDLAVKSGIYGVGEASIRELGGELARVIRGSCSGDARA